MADLTQAERERLFREHADHNVRLEQFAWFSAAPADASGRESIPLELIYESAVDESAGVGVLVNVRQMILRGLPAIADNNPETRDQVVAMLRQYGEDRRTLDRDRAVAAEVLAAMGG
jgi:hypothetical protein